MPSAEIRPSPWGPDFLRHDSWIYRTEYAALTVSLLLLVFGWRDYWLREFSWPSVLTFTFWAIWPDLAAFVLIGLASRRARTWPPWGPSLYNSVHNLLIWGIVFVAWSVLSGQVVWPLLGWAGHITADRAFGYYLRAPVSEPPT